MPPEQLLRAMLLQAFYSIRSERQLMERLEFDLLFRWFVGLGVDDPAWDHSTFSKNGDRLLEGVIAAKFMAAVLAKPRVKRRLSPDHFAVDATHLKELNLVTASDSAIFDLARSTGAVILTKDRDFVELVLRHGIPPRVIWIHCGNTANPEMIRILDTTFKTTSRL